MNFEAGLYQLREHISKGRCPFCRRFGVLHRRPTLDGLRLYECESCKTRLLVPKKVVDDAEKEVEV